MAHKGEGHHTSIRLPHDLQRKAEIFALEHDTSVSDVFRTALILLLSKEESE